MSNILGRILRLAHRSNGERLNHVRLRGVFHLRQHLVQTIGYRFLTIQPDLMAKLLHKGAQVL